MQNSVERIKYVERTFSTAIFVKYDILTEYLTLFWFAILVNEYKLYVSIQKSSKNAKFGQCTFISGGPPLLWAELMEWTSSLIRWYSVHRTNNNSLSSYITYCGNISVATCPIKWRNQFKSTSIFLEGILKENAYRSSLILISSGLS
jgi:hypothetical protein